MATGPIRQLDQPPRASVRLSSQGPAARGLMSTSFALVVLAMLTPLANAQPGFHQPLNQRTEPGKAAAWMNQIRRYDPSWMQPVRVDLPSHGDVQVYSASPNPQAMAAAPATFAVNAGHLYRLQVSNMPEFPGVDLYPTIEVLDRLHPPDGRADEFPIPVPLLSADIRLALSGQLVTRVIYLEQPQTAQKLDPLKREFPQTVGPQENALAEADRLGRPVLILRIGGRRPAGPSTPPRFFGTGGAVEARDTTLPPEVVNSRPATVVSSAVVQR